MRSPGQRGSRLWPQTRLGELVAQVVGAHPDEWERYLDGDDKVSGLFIGEVMKASERQGFRQEVHAELDRLRSRTLDERP